MSLRETLNRYPALTGFGAVVVAAGAIALLVLFLSSTDDPFPRRPTKAYYTTDDASNDGALSNLFVDHYDRITPFDHQGRSAYRAIVYTTDGGKTKFIGYLERLNARGQQIAKDIQSSKLVRAQLNDAEDELRTSGTEVKRPGDAEWVSQGNTRKSDAILNVQMPAGADPERFECIYP